MGTAEADMVAGRVPLAATAVTDTVMVAGGVLVVAVAATGSGGSLASLVPLFRGGGLAAAAVALGMSSPCRGVLVPIPGASLLPCLATPNGGDTGIKLEPLHPDLLETVPPYFGVLVSATRRISD